MGIEQFLENSARRAPDKTAVVCAGSRYTYQQLDEQANRLAHTLIDAGLQPGDRVGICLESSVSAIVSIFGILKAGGVFTVINPQTTTRQLTHILADSGAAALIARGGQIDALAARWSQLTQLKIVYVVGRDRTPIAPRGARSASFEDAVAPGAPAVPPEQRHRDGDLAALVYTSGSTGGPKGVMLSHANMMAAAAAICAYLENTPEDVILNVLPLAFTYGLGQITTAFRAGATVVLERSWAYPRVVIDTIVREHVTGFPLVPTIATLLLQQNLQAHGFPYLRYITSAAAALSTSKIQRLRAAFPGVKLYSMYGLTECQRVSYLPPDRIDAHPGSVGIPIPGSEAFVVDEQGQRAAPGAVGELVVRGPHVMKGYWNRPEATAKVLCPGPAPGEATLYTGDLFTADEAGFLYFVDRKDDMIKTRGEKVAPRQVEEVISRLPEVAEVAVYGVPDEVFGEAVAAVVTLTQGASLTGEGIQRYCLEHLEAFMVPKIVDFRDAMPTTMTGKVSRRALRADDRLEEACA